MFVKTQFNPLFLCYFIHFKIKVPSKNGFKQWIDKIKRLYQSSKYTRKLY